jgi:hypothetical protein
MTTRTELIANLRELVEYEGSPMVQQALSSAADMLEADDKLREAARLALDALDHFDDVDKTEAAISALKEAL